MTGVNNTINERESTHGDFSQTASLAQRIKNNLSDHPNYYKLDGVQREALDMIASKIARILSGNPNEPDHWHDIAGYATLARDRVTVTALQDSPISVDDIRNKVGS